MGEETSPSFPESRHGLPLPLAPRPLARFLGCLAYVREAAVAHRLAHLGVDFG
ncbi:MAG TPA: hypothetical protein VKA19_09615 [Alphaproteobacteria bacterium]|nr:hypothetical protein [Alphaproteobacteria bacterium]